MPNPTLARLLASLREQAGFATPYALAKAAGVPRSTLSRIEAGKEPSWRTVLRLARALGVSLAEFDALIPKV